MPTVRNMKRTKVIVAIIFSAAIIGAVWIGGHYLNKARGHAKTVSVVGMAERDFTSDLIVWRLSYSVLNYDMKQGYTEITVSLSFARCMTPPILGESADARNARLLFPVAAC